MNQDERMHRFDLAMDLHFAAKAVGFSGLHQDTWKWTEREIIEDVESLHKIRLDAAQKAMAQRAAVSE